MIAPYVKGRVLEIGAGIGNYSEHLLDRPYLLLSDYDPKYVSHLSERWAKPGRVEVMRLDLSDVTEQQIELVRSRDIDTVVCLNVLEHIQDDEIVVERLARSLAPGGRLVFIHPAHRFLFSKLDRIYGHHRRYDRSDAIRLAKASGLFVSVAEHFNAVGVAGWWWNHRFLGKTSLPPAQTAAFDRLVPILRRLDPAGFGRVGLSLLMVLRKPQ
jgi:2-polyprenyl-3-methyl-5-hydroxy-6-metoxy-1,4-benzoquinol methylase